MDIKAMRKEITELIDNIKLHSDELTDKPHIPQLELELIVSKIEKLYKKSIVFNFEYSQPKKAETIVKEVEKIIEPIEEIRETEKIISVSKNSIDFKNLIGINQKFQFTSELFGGNTNELSSTIEKINSVQNKDEALKIASELKVKFNWREESSVVDDFVKLIVQKFT